MDSDRCLSYNENVELIGDIIEISLHTILQMRQVYPQFTFERKQKWGAVVYKSRVGVVQSYITELIRCIKVELHKDNVENVIIIIKNSMEVGIERYIFNVQNVLDRDIPDHLKDEEFAGGLTRSQVGVYARAILIRLSSLDALLEPIDESQDLTFSVLLETKDENAGLANDKSWIGATDTATDRDIIPVRSLDTGIINLKLLCQDFN
ncbi:hypothetical protein E3P99_00293 [Wallemia hederae]|uniref:HORMA domain-containing protein n=1 Tax=Wallemia hederae TaxID=1540922 RepID=A0A4V6TMH2_9BASI|nr:hypothetical protein E3P99_00293 [Wallemia hederae]